MLRLLRPVLFSAVLAAACSKSAEPQPQTPAPAPAEPLVYRLSASTLQRQPITLATATPRNLRAHLTAPARITFDGDSTAQVAPNVRGRIVELPTKLGALVQPGDVLAVLESTDLGEAQAELLLQLRTAQTAAPLVTLARQSLERGQQLLASAQNLSQAEVARREADYQTALGTQQRAEAAAAAARNRLRLYGMDDAAIERVVQSGVVAPRLELRAPSAGQVIERRAALGALAAPDLGALFTIADPSVLWVLAEVPEARVADVGVDSAATVQLTYAPEVTCAGKVAFVAPRLDPVTRTAQARVVVHDPPPALRAGMTCEVRLDVAASRQAAAAPQLAVPESAVQQLDQRAVVFVPVLGDPAAFTLRAVEVGRPVDGYLPVFAGLQAGEQVVADGSFVLKAIATQAASEGN